MVSEETGYFPLFEGNASRGLSESENNPTQWPMTRGGKNWKNEHYWIYIAEFYSI